MLLWFLYSSKFLIKVDENSISIFTRIKPNFPCLVSTWVAGNFVQGIKSYLPTWLTGRLADTLICLLCHLWCLQEGNQFCLLHRKEAWAGDCTKDQCCRLSREEYNSKHPEFALHKLSQDTNQHKSNLSF